MTKVSISRQIFFVASAAALTLFVLAPAMASAGSFTITNTFSGSAANVPIDLDGNNCGPVNGVTTCPADSFVTTGGGSVRGGPDAGPFTFQTVTESVLAPGTGCSFAPTTVQGCTVGSVSDGCLLTYVAGNGVARVTSNGDLYIYALTSGTVCVNYDTALPWSFEGQEQWAFTGGTGKLANAGGSVTTKFQGQILQNDRQGHGLEWVSGSNTGTLTLP